MTQEQAYATLREIFSEVLVRDVVDLRPELAPGDVEGWTSHRTIEILMAVEERLGIHFTSREIGGLENVGDLVALIVQKLS